jgi:hypothetical protein
MNDLYIQIDEKDIFYNCLNTRFGWNIYFLYSLYYGTHSGSYNTSSGVSADTSSGNKDLHHEDSDSQNTIQKKIQIVRVPI